MVNTGLDQVPRLSSTFHGLGISLVTFDISKVLAVIFVLEVSLPLGRFSLKDCPNIKFL